MAYLGLDIGTTTVCGVVLDEKYNVLKSITRANTSEIKSDRLYERIQDPEITFSLVKEIADEFLDEFEISSIGISGQMHGILYLDKDGKALSPLYYWQDKRALQNYDEKSTYLDELKKRTGMNISSGYGAASHFANMFMNEVMENAEKICTIGDYVAMRLAGRKKPLVHSSEAASIGLYDLKNLVFDRKAIEKAGMDFSLFPETCTTREVLGTYRNADVAVSLGDNQASFYGSKTPSDGILVNVGTGSQISLVSDYKETEEGIECRPLNNHDYLLVGAAICGGKSYAVLKNFFEQCADMFSVKIADMYSLMNKEASKGEDELQVDTRFLGTRSDPSIKGKIENISDFNLTPANLIKGFNRGMAKELYDLYLKMGKPEKKVLIGSGNGCRYNEGFVKETEELFKLTLQLSDCKEEAASGAAIFGKGD